MLYLISVIFLWLIASLWNHIININILKIINFMPVWYILFITIFNYGRNHNTKRQLIWRMLQEHNISFYFSIIYSAHNWVIYIYWNIYILYMQYILNGNLGYTCQWEKYFLWNNIHVIFINYSNICIYIYT